MTDAAKVRLEILALIEGSRVTALHFYPELPKPNEFLEVYYSVKVPPEKEADYNLAFNFTEDDYIAMPNMGRILEERDSDGACYRHPECSWSLMVIQYTKEAAKTLPFMKDFLNQREW